MVKNLEGSAVERWVELRQAALDAARTTTETMSTPDPRGLLLLANWLARETVELLNLAELNEITSALCVTTRYDSARRRELEQLLYDDLFELLRRAGCLV
jgi:hypothetical protein